MVVFSQSVASLTRACKIAIAIQKTRYGRHVGIVYRKNDNSLRFCHLRFHFDFADEPLPNDYHVAPSGLDNYNQAFMAAQMHLVKDNAQIIAYGLDAEPCFDDDLKYIPMPVGKGLTCATFVTSIFEGNGYEVINKSSWSIRSEDVAWQTQIVSLLNGHASKTHVDEAKKDIGQVSRFRPEEVIGAATEDSNKWPISFEDAKVVAAKILEDLKI